MCVWVGGCLGGLGRGHTGYGSKMCKAGRRQVRAELPFASLGGIVCTETFSPSSHLPVIPMPSLPVLSLSLGHAGLFSACNYTSGVWSI